MLSHTFAVVALVFTAAPIGCDSGPSGVVEEAAVIADASNSTTDQLVSIGAADFGLEFGAGTLANGIWTLSSSTSSKLSATLRIPVGTTLQEIAFLLGPGPSTIATLGLRKLSQQDGGATNTVRIVPVTVGSWGVVGMLNSPGSGQPTLPETIGTLFSYTAEITFSPSSPSPKFTGAAYRVNGQGGGTGTTP